MFVVALLATVAFAAAGVHAWIVPPDLDLMRVHVLPTMVSSLLLIFPQVWVLIYLLATGRVVRRELADGAASPADLATSRRLRRRALPPVALSATAALVTVLLGFGLVSGAAEGPAHALAFVATLTLQLWALAVEWPTLRDHARLLRELEARES